MHEKKNMVNVTFLDKCNIFSGGDCGFCNGTIFNHMSRGVLVLAVFHRAGFHTSIVLL